MKDASNKRERQRGIPLLLSIILIFSIFGTIVFSISRKISEEMSASAIQNLSESLDLIQSTIEAILRSQAEFQALIAQELARAENPEAYIRAYERNQTMVKLSLIPAGEEEGFSNTGEPFTGEELDFSAQRILQSEGVAVYHGCGEPALCFKTQGNGAAERRPPGSDGFLPCQ